MGKRSIAKSRYVNTKPGQKGVIAYENLPARVAVLVEASLADNTHLAYRSAVRAFGDWCDTRGYEVLPAHPLHVAEYLSDLVALGRRATTARSHACAIAHNHRRANMASPIDSYIVRAVLRGSKRLRGSYVDQKLPTVFDDIALVLEQIPNTLTGVRDKAMIALGFAGALRRSELVAIRFDDLEFSSQNLILRIRKSKTDIESKGVIIGIPDGSHLRAVSLLKEWLNAASITRGPIFRPVYRNRVISRHVAPLLVSRVLKTYLAKAGLDAALYGAHSLRSGFITSAAESGVGLERIMDHSRHVDAKNVRAYVRRSNLFRDHCGDSFL